MKYVYNVRTYCGVMLCTVYLLYIQLRSSCRFLVGNLSDFSPENHLVPYDDLRTLDQYILHLLYNYCEQVSIRLQSSVNTVCEEHFGAPEVYSAVFDKTVFTHVAVQVGNSYEAYNFSKIYHLVVNLTTKDLSAFYFDIIKDWYVCGTELWVRIVELSRAFGVIMSSLT